jgi:MFS transporter, FHS family, Na+ dependent glucose transporter 1
MNQPTVAVTTDFPATQSTHPTHLVISYYLAFMALGLMMMALGTTLTELAQRTQSEFHQISYSFMSRSLGFILGSIFGGRIYDHLRGHKVLASALAGLAILAAFVPVTSSLKMLIGLFLIQGLVGSLINVGGNTLLMWSHRDSNIGALLTGLHFSWGLGSAVAPLIVEQVEAWSGDINWAYWTLSLTVLPACILLLRLPSPAHPYASDKDSKAPVNMLLAVLVACFFFLYTGFEASIINWIHTYTMKAGLGDKSAAYKLNAAFLMTYTFGRLLAIPIASKVRPRTILIADFSGIFLSVVVILAWPSSARVFWIACCTLGLSMASVFPTMLSFAERRMSLSGKLTGYLFSAASGGSMILPLLVGQFFTSVGPQVLFYIVLAALAIDTVIFTVMMMLYPSHTKA